MDKPRPSPRTNWTSLVPPLVLTRQASSLLAGISLTLFANGTGAADRSAPPRAGADTGLALAFTPSDQIAGGDNITLSLPGFTGGAGGPGDELDVAAAHVADAAGRPHPVFTAARFARAAGTLRLLARNATAPAGVPVFVVVLPDAGVRAPAAGLLANLSSGITAACDCAATPQRAAPLANVSAIPAAFAGLRVSDLPASAEAHAPQANGLEVQLEEAPGGASGAPVLLQAGDRLALRAVGDSCLAARFDNQAVAVRSHDLVLEGTPLSARLNASNLIPGCRYPAFPKKR